MRHSLLVYDDDDEMVAHAAPFLRRGLAAGARAVVVIDRPKWDTLARALGPDADAVLSVERLAFYTRPEAAIAQYDGLLRRYERAGVRAVRVFAELPPCRTAEELDRWLAYEAIFNRAFAHHSLWVTCGYDTREVSPSLLEGALETHPEILAQESARNPRYHEPEEVVRARTPTPGPLAGLHALSLDNGPRGFRRALGAELETAEVADRDAVGMLVAAEEVLRNATRHGGEALSVRVGRVGDRFVCEIADDGSGIDDPIVGFLPPRQGHTEGAGLWVARQLTRKLELVPAERGATVRLSV